MSRKIAFTFLCVFVAALLMIPDIASAQCPNNGEPVKTKLKSNEFYKVVSPNHIKFRPGVYFELVKAADGKEFLRYGKLSNGKLSFMVDAGIECVCHCSEYECTTTVSGGDAKCRGGCYEGGQPCTSCHFDLEQ